MTIFLRGSLLVCFFLLYPASSALAQADHFDKTRMAFLTKAKTAKFPPQIERTILRLADRLQRDHGPGVEVLLKALEGIAKKIPPVRIEATVKQYAKELREAHTIVKASLPTDLSPRDRKRVFQEVLKALQRGMPAKDIRKAIRDHLASKRPWHEFGKRLKPARRPPPQKK